jgi:osmotically-inducible protein OsmY
MSKLDDLTTNAQVKAALMAAEGLEALHIHVETIEGVVHLRGWVHTTEQRERAGDVARVYDGCVVENELEVRPAPAV